MGQATGQRKSTVASVTSQNHTKKQRAAILLAEDALSDEKIAQDVGVTRRTLATWKLDPEFAALVGDYTGKIIADALRLPIAKKHERVRILNDSLMADLEAQRLRAETYADRADSPPWAATGKFVEQPKISANGTIVTEWAYDRAMESAISEKLKQAAQELGQLVEKSEVAQTTTMVQIIADEDA